MMRSETTPIKKLLIVLTALLAACVIVVLPFFGFKWSSKSKKDDVVCEKIGLDAPLLLDGSCEMPGKKSHDGCQDASTMWSNPQKGLATVFEKENIIPARSAKTEEKSKQPSFYEKVLSYFRRKTPEALSSLELTPEEMAIQLKSSENILINYDAGLVRKINAMKSKQKQMIIVDIRRLTLMLSTLLPSESSLMEESNNLFWLTVYISGDLMIDWMAYTLSVEELMDIRNSLSALCSSVEEPSDIRMEMFAILKRFVQDISKKTEFGGNITSTREDIARILKEYKSEQEMVGLTDESCETEKLLLALDVLSYLIPMTSESNNEIQKTVQTVREKLVNAIQSTARRQMNDYLLVTKRSNCMVIAAINEYMRFLSDLEQYIGVNLVSSEHLKNIKKANNSTFSYDIKESMPASDVIKTVNRMIAFANELFKQYVHLLNTKEGENTYNIFLLDSNDLSENPLEESAEVEDE
ncbi:uncharacterized protein NEMAJ01_0932 [Nematocida major]|uniref:uncharacterized protein n=1 Tax=Nematocida major TaxID=1912982 RepID=UPI002007A952|nr:uncharacterized protein NEMAJ01_0932 [Nematocida major]KAH9386036.1 hypothetical protein NEMAJ01_0932 [Nematocida major]